MKKTSARINLILIGIAAVLCMTACSPKEASDTSNSDAKTTSIDFAFAEDSDCAMCHTVESTSATDGSCLASQASHASTECVSCHTFNEDLEKAHAKVKAGETPRDELRRTKVEDDACLSCHDYEELAEKTASSTALVDANSLTVNPHEVYKTGLSHNDIACSNCHEMHKADTPKETAQATCLSCHHENVFECGTCHS